MNGFIIVTFTVALLGFIYVFLIRSTNRKLPKGVRTAPLERGWLILGILPSIVYPLHQYFVQLGKKHGALFRIQFGMREIFVLNNYDVLKKCLKDDGENFSGRWNGKIIEIAVKNSGITMIDGTNWAKNRSFMLKVLRDFGFGKSRTTEIVQEECRYLLTELETLEGKTLDFSELIPVYTANIISKFIMNKRYDRNNEDFKFIKNLIDTLTKRLDWLQIFLFLFPKFDKSNFLSKIILLLSSRVAWFEHMYSIFRKEIQSHLKSLDLDSEGEDLMDRFLIEQSKVKAKNGSVGSFTEFQLIRSSFELFAAGFETTSTTLGWSLLFLSKYDEIQTRLHEEIVDLIGLDQLPTSKDRKSLPLTQAIMDEVLRLSSVAPLAIMHRNFKDTVVDGIFIPANSLIYPNLYACHRDATVWERPFEFYPEHFLIKTDDGALKYNPSEELNPFGLGKRQCLGESLARAEYFIFLASIVQRFRVRFAKTICEEEYQKALVGGDGIIRFSQIKHFIFEKYKS